MIEQLSPEARTFLSDFLNQIEYEKDKEIERLQEDIGNYVNIVLHDRKEIDRLNIIINRIKSIYSSLCFSAPENNYIFIEQLGEVLQELKGSDKE